MRIETMIVDTDHACNNWYSVTITENDGRVTVDSERTFGAALERGVRAANSIMDDAYRLEHEPNLLFAADLQHEYPVIITIAGDYHSVVYVINEVED